MKKFLPVLLLLLPGLLNAQNDAKTGIHFENLPDWNSVKAKAKQENKYIFVDCFATWCGPCKWMDKNVFPIDSIGKFFTDNYLSVKIQMDSTAGDKEEIKSWYADARRLQMDYKILDFPYYLFFSPDGKLTDRSMGAWRPTDFYALARRSLNPRKQYYPLLESFYQGKLGYADMPYLANYARTINDTLVARQVSKTYIDEYLLQDESRFYTPGNLWFAAAFVQSSTDKAFKLINNSPRKIDSIVNKKGFAWNVVSKIIESEEIDSRLYNNQKPIQKVTGRPDWTSIRRIIKNRYNGDYSDRIVLWAKIKWFESRKDWPEYCRNVIIKVEKYGPYYKNDPNGNLPANFAWNLFAWELFCYCTDRSQLEKALSWSEKALKLDAVPDSHNLDTYANLLHKLGRTAEAISYEEKAVAIVSNNKEDMISCLNKMKKASQRGQRNI